MPESSTAGLTGNALHELLIHTDLGLENNLNLARKRDSARWLPAGSVPNEYITGFILLLLKWDFTQLHLLQFFLTVWEETKCHFVSLPAILHILWTSLMCHWHIRTGSLGYSLFPATHRKPQNKQTLSVTYSVKHSQSDRSSIEEIRITSRNLSSSLPHL